MFDSWAGSKTAVVVVQWQMIESFCFPPPHNQVC